jgi:putative inorganic carbon (hco3(-)) transporter
MLQTADFGTLAAFVFAGVLLWQGLGWAGAIAFLTVCVGAAAVSPAGAMIAILAAIPLVAQPVDIGASRFSLLELGIVAGGIGLTVHLLVRSVRARSLAPIWSLMLPLPTTCFVLAIFVAGLISITEVADPYRFAESLRFFRWTVLEPVVLFFVARYVVQQRGPSAIGVAIFIPAVVVSALALGQAIVREGGYAVDSTFRAMGPYDHPNNLALYLERPLLLVLALFAAVKGRQRWVVAVALALLIVGLIATLSRGAVLGVTVGLALILAMHHVRRFGIIVLGIGMSSVGAFFLLAGDRLLGAGSSGVIEGRTPIWRAALQMIRDFPFRGIGLDQFLGMHRARYMAPVYWSERYISHPHNLVLDTWLSLGLPGLLLLGVAVVGLVRRTMVAREFSDRLNPWTVGSLAALFGGLVHGLVDNGFFLPDLAALTLALVALTDSEVVPISHQRRFQSDKAHVLSERASRLGEP